MAESPAHKFGQVIGEVLEEAVRPLLAKFAKKHELYFDKKGSRPARPGKQCTWRDLNKNAHDLDFVLERGGTDAKLGIPAAFIETTWRRYTKHSRNKAQEIQGAILPLAETYRNARPFIGVILAGVFTKGALAQLRSLGFSVLHFSYESVVAAFKQFGIDAFFDESTPRSEFRKKIALYGALSTEERRLLAQALLRTQGIEVRQFMSTLKKVVLRQIDRITILPLHGRPTDLETIADAILFIQSYKEPAKALPIVRYEILVRYNNGDSIEANYEVKKDAIEFLQSYLPVLPPKNN